jgi:hypothetical protein
MAKRKTGAKKKRKSRSLKTPTAPKPSEPPPVTAASVGYGKSLAAVFAGAVSTIVIWVLKMKMGADQVPAEIAGAIQTLITTGAVFFTPQLLRQRA